MCAFGADGPRGTIDFRVMRECKRATSGALRPLGPESDSAHKTATGVSFMILEAAMITASAGLISPIGAAGTDNIAAEVTIALITCSRPKVRESDTQS